MDNWQPISTAPRDGTLFLATYSGKRIYTCSSQRLNRFGPEKKGGGCDVIAVEFGGFAEITTDAILPRDPKYWMPFPEPPES